MIAVFLPDTPWLEDIVPIGMIGDDEAALPGNEKGSTLNELEIELWQVRSFRFQFTTEHVHIPVSGRSN